MANRNVSTLTTSERLATLLNTYYAKKSAVVNSLNATANKGIEIGGTSTAPTVGIKLSEKAGNALSFATGENEDGGLYYNTPAADQYSVVKQATAESGYFATYQLTKNSTGVGEKINIPKDFLVKGAEIKTVSTADDPYEGAEVGDKYIDFTINVKSGTATDEHLYLPVNELVDAYAGDNLGIVLGANNTFSLKIKTGSPLTVTSDGLDIDEATTTTKGAMSAADKTKLNGISTGAKKVEASATNGNVKIDDVETTVYTLPASVVHDTDLADYTEAELRTLLGLPAAE